MTAEHRKLLRKKLEEDESLAAPHDCIVVLHLTQAQREWLQAKRKNRTHGRHGIGWYMRRLLVAHMVREEWDNLVKGS